MADTDPRGAYTRPSVGYARTFPNRSQDRVRYIACHCFSRLLAAYWYICDTLVEHTSVIWYNTAMSNGKRIGDSEFVTPNSVVLSGEGLRELDEQGFISFVGEMAQRGILVHPLGVDQPYTAEQQPKILLGLDDFKENGADRYTPARTFNALARPAGHYRTARDKQAEGAELYRWELEALRLDPRIVALSPYKHTIDYDALLEAYHADVLSEIFGIGEHSIELISRVLDAKAAELEQNSSTANDVE